MQWRRPLLVLALVCALAAGGVAAAAGTVYSQWPFSASDAQQRQQETAQAWGVPAQATVDLGAGVTMDLVLIPAGEFVMGGDMTPEQVAQISSGEPDMFRDEQPPHRVRIARPFYMSTTEVTNAQYDRFVAEAGYDGVPEADSDYLRNRHEMGGEACTAADCPVAWVSWNNAQAFCRWLSQKWGNEVTLATEAQWEYASRAGADTAWCFGDAASSLDQYAWHKDVAGSATHAVGQKTPNAWGLRDMYGNVDEWCLDWYAADYYGSSAMDDPTGPSSAAKRVLRGGSFLGPASFCRSAFRNSAQPAMTYGDSGFRVVVPLGVPAAAATQNVPPPAAVTEPKASTGPGTVYSAWPFSAADAQQRQQQTAGALGVPVEGNLDLGGGVMLHLVLVPAGEFVMGGDMTPEQVAQLGSAGADMFRDEQPQHRARITRPFYMASLEVTNGQYDYFVQQSGYSGTADADQDYLRHHQDTDGKAPTGAGYPVVWVSWNNAQAFCRWASQQSGTDVRLPTEAQWEYACRAGAAASRCYGGDQATLDQYAWHSQDSGGHTNPVGGKTANVWGLYDMHGNVDEWCNDWYGETYYASSSVDDPAGMAAGEKRVLRGASFEGPPQFCRSSFRNMAGPNGTFVDTGFRVIVTMP